MFRFGGRTGEGRSGIGARYADTYDMSRAVAAASLEVEPLIASIRSVLSDDLLKPAFRLRSNRRASSGHCYAASEALYHALGGRAVGLTPMRLRHEDDPHWYLRTAEGTFLDPTGDQFTSAPPHANGVGCGFLTREPSRRAAEILRRLSVLGDVAT